MGIHLLFVIGPILFAHMLGDACEGVKSRGFASFHMPPLPPRWLPESQRMQVDKSWQDRQTEQMGGERREQQIQAAVNSSLAMSYRRCCPWVRTIHFTWIL